MEKAVSVRQSMPKSKHYSRFCHWLDPAREICRCWQGTEVGGAGEGRIPAGAAVTAELEEELAETADVGVASKNGGADAVGGGSPKGSGSVEGERARDADAGSECVDDRTQQLHWHPAAPHAVATAAIAVIATFAKLGSA